MQWVMFAATLVSSTLLMAAPEPVAPVPDREYALAVNRAARGVGLGYHNGLWGRTFAQGLHLDIPFGWRVGQFFGLRLQGTFAHAEVADRYDPVVFGGVELFGRTPVMAGLLRMYGGGGVFLGGRPLPGEGSRYGVGGGGHLGIEAFINPRMAFAIQVGGQAPVHALGVDAGANVMGHINVYFGRR
jgi:hypothetical protein